MNETHAPCPGPESVITEQSIENGMNEEGQKRLYQLHDQGTNVTRLVFFCLLIPYAINVVLNYL